MENTPKPEKVTRWQAQDGSLHETEREAESVNAQLAARVELSALLESSVGWREIDDVLDTLINNADVIIAALARWSKGTDRCTP